MRVAALMFVLSALPALADEEAWFRSPSGNIHCMILTGGWTGARCDIAEFSPSFARPADCELDWGYAFEVAPEGPAAPLCAGDTVRDPRARVLEYGRYISLGGITCVSERTGMTCTNLDGHGFTLSRARQSLF